MHRKEYKVMSKNANAPNDKDLNGVTRLVETAAESGEVEF